MAKRIRFNWTGRSLLRLESVAVRSLFERRHRSYKMLSTLIELQRLKRLDRTGWTLRGLPNGTESVASHSFGVSVTAMLLADRCGAAGVTVDVQKLLRIALLH